MQLYCRACQKLMNGDIFPNMCSCVISRNEAKYQVQGPHKYFMQVSATPLPPIQIKEKALHTKHRIHSTT